MAKPRDRTGYLMVRLSPEHRARLEAIRAQLADQLKVSVTMADVVRRWIEREKIPPKKNQNSD